MKENKNTRLKSSLLGQNDLVYSFGIMSPENPMGKKQTSTYNRKARESIEEKIKKLKYDYIRIDGKYIIEEKSYFIININYEDMEYLNHYFNQESFIWARKYWDDTVDYSPYINFYYYEKASKDSDYILGDMEDHIKNQKDAEDFFSSLKNYKFKVPFSIFENLIPEANRLLFEKYGHLEKSILIEGILNNLLDSSLTSKKKWHDRCLLFESLEKKIERFKRIQEAVNMDNSLSKSLSKEFFEYKEKGFF
jgi:hypothetical protein